VGSQQTMKIDEDPGIDSPTMRRGLLSNPSEGDIRAVSGPLPLGSVPARRCRPARNLVGSRGWRRRMAGRPRVL